MSDNNNLSNNDELSSGLSGTLFQLLGAVNKNGTTSSKSIADQNFIASLFGTTRDKIISADYIPCFNDEEKEINLIISDLDNTLIDAYSEASKLFLDLEHYIAEKTGYTVAQVHNTLKKEINTEKNFTSAEFFSFDGYKKVLKSSIWKGLDISEDAIKRFDKGFRKSYSATYPDALKLFDQLNGCVPIVIHTDAPLEQAMSKLIKGGFIRLGHDKNGDLCATSLVSGISASNRSSSKDAKAQVEANRKIAEIKEALAKIGVFVTTYDKKFEKPAPEPLRVILSELNRTKGLTFKKENILMIGDSLSKDIAFAANNGINSAWMLGCTRVSDDVRHLEHASHANRHPMSWQKQVKFFCNKSNFGKDTAKKILANTTICISHQDLLKKYKFRPSSQDLSKQVATKSLADNERKM